MGKRRNRVCGADVHKDIIVATILSADDTELQEKFGTTSVTGGLKVSNNGGIKMSTCQSLDVKTRGNVDVKHGGVPHVARFIQPRIEHQRDRQTDRTQPCYSSEIPEFSSSTFAPKEA
jgi:hypothetical protein